MKSGIITSEHKLSQLMSLLGQHTEFAFDTETDGLSYDRRCIPPRGVCRLVHTYGA